MPRNRSPKPAFHFAFGEPSGYANACVEVRNATSGSPPSTGARNASRKRSSSRSNLRYATVASIQRERSAFVSPVFTFGSGVSGLAGSLASETTVRARPVRSVISARNGRVTSLRYSSSAATNRTSGAAGCQPFGNAGWNASRGPRPKSRARSPFTGSPFGPRNSPRMPRLPVTNGARSWIRETTATSSPGASPSPDATRSIRTRCQTLVVRGPGPGFSSIERTVTSSCTGSW